MAKSNKSKSKSNQPAFEDGSYFKDVPMFVQNEQGEWIVPEEGE